MYQDKSVNKNCLLKKFLNDINKIEMAKRGSIISRCSLKPGKPKSFALPMRPKHFNKKFLMHLDGIGRSMHHSSNSSALCHSKSNIFEPEVNILVENRAVRNCISFTKVATSTPIDMDIHSEMPSKINFRNISMSTRVDEKSNFTNTQFINTNEANHIRNQFVPDVLNGNNNVVRRKTIYDYAAENSIIDDINIDKQYAKLKAHLNTNILEKLDLEYFQTSNKCEKLVNKINLYKKLDILDKWPKQQATAQFCNPIYNMSTIQKLLTETPSKEMSTFFAKETESTYFELECMHKEEVLWTQPRSNKKIQATKQIESHNKITNLENTTFFEKPDIDREFLKFFSMQ